MSVQPPKSASPIKFLCEELTIVDVFSARKIFTTFCAPFLIEYFVAQRQASGCGPASKECTPYGD